jgi:beta-phosphoglucomutase-like phosphatase (HAD superfamily)
MVKLVVFDLDGVLVDARELHYDAMNGALREVAGEPFVISRGEHLSIYDGLPTRKKLAMLSQKKFLPEDLHSNIWKKKQEMTVCR